MSKDKYLSIFRPKWKLLSLLSSNLLARRAVLKIVEYSCFEKGCPTKLYATMPKGIMGNGGL